MGELLFEIGTEEIPAGYMGPALEYFGDAAGKSFASLGLAFGKISTFGTPRRLTLIVDDLQEKQPDQVVEHVGPSTKAGYDENGAPSKAAIGFARSKGIAVEDLQVKETEKGEYLVAIEDVRGSLTVELLPDVLKNLLKNMPFPKSMRWGHGNFTFVRPIQWLLAIFDGKPVDLSLDAIDAGRSTYGHRFMAPQRITVDNCSRYREQLRENWIIVDQQERREKVIAEVQNAVQNQCGEGDAQPVLDDDLIDTVTNLVEYPWGVCGKFEDKFLDLPREVLVTSMREHQKYFPVVGGDGELLPFFVAVNNTRISDLEMAVNGHQRVLRARLEDALFFFTEDKKRTLVSRRQDLAGIVFQKKLGSMFDKSQRVASLAGQLADIIDPGNRENAERAAQLAKCDLLTEIVGEFPSLQGVMGREYALLDNENEEVAWAIHEHYKPVRAGGELPERIVGAIVGIADRADTLAGCFAIGEKPTGTTDPFGLRRQALGLLHIISGHSLHISLQEILQIALSGYEGVVHVDENTMTELMEFIRLRFENDLIAGGTKPEIVTAGTSVAFDDIVDSRSRIEALARINRREQFAVLAGSFKRINNIIKQNRETDIQESLLTDGAEKDLYDTLKGVKVKITPFITAGSYDAALDVMLEMKEPVDRFFDDVMVMTDDRRVRQNRLNLLTALKEIVLQVGDISRMHQESSS